MAISSNNYMDNMGGINKLYPIDIDNVLSFSNAFHGKLRTFSVDERIEIAVDREQSLVTEKHKTSANGNYFDTQIKAVIPKDREDIIEWVNENQNKRFVVVYVDNNGLIKVAGNPDEPLQMLADHSPGDINKLNSYRFTFQRQMRSRAYLLSELPTLVLPT